MGCGSEALETKRQKRGPVPVGKIPEVADADESLREQVKQKAAQELICVERHGKLPIAMRAVSPAEGDLSVGKGNQAVIGNRHSMGVATEIAENIFRATEGPFTVDDPVVAEQFTDKGVKCLRLRKMPQAPMETDSALGECVFQRLPELASKHAPEHLFREKEAIAGIDAHPAPMIEGQSTRRDYTVYVGMMLHLLSPGVEHAEETNLGTQEFGIAGNLDQRFSTETQQQRIDQFLVLQCERRQEMRHREYDVGIGDGKKFFPSRVDPAQAGVGLTFWTMPITARVVGVAGIPATGALVDMPAKSSCTASFDRSQDFQMLDSDPPAAAFDEWLSHCADDIGHLQRWSIHLWLFRLFCFF